MTGSKNLMKTYYVNFTVKNKVARNMGDIGAILTFMNHIKFLGLTIQSESVWDRHTNELVKKLYTACYMIET
jgi:hypothetical protein